MLEKIPNDETMIALIGSPLYDVWMSLCSLIASKYDMERIWNRGFQEWKYEYKFRRGGKTLCTLYAKENNFSLLIVLGKAEREKFEAEKTGYSEKIRRVYDETQTYHDGKWMWLDVTETSLFPDIERLLLLKRKPNKK